MNRYLWDPTSAGGDELVQFRGVVAVDADGAGAGGPPTIVEVENRWALTDRHGAVIGLMDDAAVVAAAANPSTAA